MEGIKEVYRKYEESLQRVYRKYVETYVGSIQKV